MSDKEYGVLEFVMSKGYQDLLKERDSLRSRLRAAEAVCEWADRFDNHQSITQQQHCRKLVNAWRAKSEEGK